MIDFVSPVSGRPLVAKNDQLVASEDESESYPVVREIPRFVSASNYAQAFGLEWSVHRQTQTEGKWKDITKQRLEGCLGTPLSELDGLMVMEAGCGAGRFTEQLVESGANVHAFDLSIAVEANKMNTGNRPNYTIAQADITAPPFPPGSFDVVICLGVLQHTPSPEASTEALYNMVKPGGLLVIDHYELAIKMATKINSWLLRPILKRMKPERAMKITDLLVKIFFPIHYACRNFYPAQMLLSRISPCYVFFREFPELTKEQHYAQCKLDTFDGLTDYYKHLRTVGQIRRMLEKLGGEDIWARSRSGTNVEARCRKPAA